MSSADFLLYKPLQLSGAVSFSRPSVKNVYDRAGTLVEVPANVLGLTYDPANLRKAPWALIESAAPNLVAYSEQFDHSSWVKVGGVSVTPSAGISPNGANTAYFLKEGLATSPYIANGNAISAGDLLALSVFVKLAPTGEDRQLALIFTDPPVGTNQIAIFDIVKKTKVAIAGTPEMSIEPLPNGWYRCGITCRAVASGPVNIQFRLAKNNSINQVGDGISGLLIWGGMLSPNGLSSYFKTISAPATRAADVVGAGAGLVYSSVAITEPLWVAGTYAQGAKVRDGDNFVFESLAGSNSAPLTEKTKWLPLGKTNQLKMFDKAVNSQTTAPDSLTVVVKPGQLANTLTLLNVSGAEVTVTQSESGYTRQQALATHNVLSWYDFYYQEPQWIGDTVFADMPPYLNSLITVHVKSPGNIAGLGGFFLGRPKFIGKTQWGLKAGILSYSSQEADTFGNVTLMKRASAKKMNFEVAVPRGYEDEVYRFMTAADNEEMIAIASTNWAMTLSYGYLGQWELPLGIEGEKMPVEWRGLI